jgi:hypothetical protein
MLHVVHCDMKPVPHCLRSVEAADLVVAHDPAMPVNSWGGRKIVFTSESTPHREIDATLDVVTVRQ